MSVPITNFVLGRLKQWEVYMGSFQNASKSKPCPICGKPDWCSFLTPDSPAYPGQELCICRRILLPEILSPINQKKYYFIKELPDNSALYTDVEKFRQKESLSTPYIYRSHSKPKSEHTTVLLRPNAELDIIYKELLHLLPLSKKHISKLLKDGWSTSLIRSSGIRSLILPKTYNKEKGYCIDDVERIKICKFLLKKHETLQGVPGFYQDDSGHWTFTGRSGMLIPLYDINGLLYRLRLRLDYPKQDELGKPLNKYMNFSSYYETKSDDVLSNIYKNGCRSGSQISVYYNPATDDPSICYFTEGEKKAIVANHFLKHIVISIPGTNSYRKLEQPNSKNITPLDYLRECGCKTAVVAYDSDKYWNEQVSRCEGKLVDLLKTHSFDTYIGDWNPGFGKGLDDILVLGVLPKLLPT